MIPLKNFEEFIREGIVKKQSPDKERANSLIKEAENKKAFLNKILENMPFNEVSPNFIIESIYDILLELVRAKLFTDGFNSNSSHEAEVSYMRKLEFGEFEVSFMNQLRYFRNGIKYYGKILDAEYARKVLDFLYMLYPKLKMKLKM